MVPVSQLHADLGFRFPDCSASIRAFIRALMRASAPLRRLSLASNTSVAFGINGRAASTSL
jgi:hypothetical protein